MLRHLPILSAPNLVAVVVAVVAVGSFFISRFWRENAPCDEWLPALFMGIAIASAGVHYRGDSLALQLTTHVSLLLTMMIATTMSLGLLAVFRRPATWRATAGLALQGPLLLVVQYGHHPHRPVWTVVLVALGTAALYGTLVSFSRPEHRWVSRGAAVVALFFLGGQLIEQGSQGNYFTVNLIALISLVTLAVARRRQPLISTPVLLGSAVVAGLTWGRWDDYTNHLGYWLVGGSLVLLAALHDVDQEDSYTTLAPGLLFGFTAGVLQLVQLANGSSPTTRIVLVALATVVTVGGFIARRDAAIEIGAVASAIGLTVYVPGETAWSVTAVALSVIATLMGTQQRRPSLRVTERSAKLTGGVGVALWGVSLIIALTNLHHERTLLIVLVGLVTLTAARRLGWSIDGMQLVGAAGAVGVVWTTSFSAIPGAGVIIGVGGLVLLALSLGVDTPQHRSWIEWGPTLLFVMIPANFSALSGSVVSASVTILVAVGLIIIAIAQRKRAVFDVALATFAILSVARLSQVVSDRSRWLVAVLVGVALIGNGLWRETRRSHDDDATPTSWYRSLT